MTDMVSYTKNDDLEVYHVPIVPKYQPVRGPAWGLVIVSYLLSTKTRKRVVCSVSFI